MQVGAAIFNHGGSPLIGAKCGMAQSPKASASSHGMGCPGTASVARSVGAA